MSLPLSTISTNNISSLEDLPNDTGASPLTSAQLKAKYDKFSVDWSSFYNDTLVPLIATMDDLSGIVAGSISDNSLGIEKLNFDVATQLELDTLIAQVGDLADLNTTIKSEIVAAINEIYAALPKSILTTQGDLIVHDGTSATRIAKGSAYQVLGMNSGATAQQYLSSLQSLLTTAGAIVYASTPNTPASLAIGTAGYPLISNGTIPVYGIPYALSAIASNNTILSALTERTETGTSGASGAVRITDYAGNVIYTLNLGAGYTTYTTVSVDVNVPCGPVNGTAYIYIDLNYNTSGASYVNKKIFKLKIGGTYRVVFDIIHNTSGPSFPISIKNVYVKGDYTAANDAVTLD